MGQSLYLVFLENFDDGAHVAAALALVEHPPEGLPQPLLLCLKVLLHYLDELGLGDLCLWVEAEHVPKLLRVEVLGEQVLADDAKSRLVW